MAVFVSGGQHMPRDLAASVVALLERDERPRAIYFDWGHEPKRLAVTPDPETRVISGFTTALGDGKTSSGVLTMEGTDLIFTPTDFFDGNDEADVSVDILRESKQMLTLTEKLTILPVTVVYYEDDFAAIDYNENEDEISIETDGKGSGGYEQSANPGDNYGYDGTYTENGSESSLGTYHKLSIL